MKDSRIIAPQYSSNVRDGYTTFEVLDGDVAPHRKPIKKFRKQHTENEAWLVKVMSNINEDFTPKADAVMEQAVLKFNALEFPDMRNDAFEFTTMCNDAYEKARMDASVEREAAMKESIAEMHRVVNANMKVEVQEATSTLLVKVASYAVPALKVIGLVGLGAAGMYAFQVGKASKASTTV